MTIADRRPFQMLDSDTPPIDITCQTTTPPLSSQVPTYFFKNGAIPKHSASSVPSSTTITTTFSQSGFIGISSVSSSQTAPSSVVQNLSSVTTFVPYIATSTHFISTSTTESLSAQTVIPQNDQGLFTDDIDVNHRGASQTPDPPAIEQMGNSRRNIKKTQKTTVVDDVNTDILQKQIYAATARIAVLDSDIVEKDKRISLLRDRIKVLEENENRQAYNQYFPSSRISFIHSRHWDPVPLSAIANAQADIFIISVYLDANAHSPRSPRKDVHVLIIRLTML